MAEYEFEDVLIKPKFSRTETRKNCDTSISFKTHIGPVKIEMPIFISPMAFYDHRTIEKIDGLMFAFLPRFRAPNLPSDEGARHPNWQKIEVRLRYAKTLFKKGYKFGVAIGLKDEKAFDKIIELAENSYILLIDTANGYLEKVIKFAEKVINETRKVFGQEAVVMTGNVVEREGYRRLEDIGVKFIRVGIGTGSNCLTRIKTGVGRAQFSAISECYEAAKNTYVVADGGIKGPGDLCKALGRSHFIMTSALFKDTDLNIHRPNREGLRPAYGMASEFIAGDYGYIEGTVSFHKDSGDFRKRYNELKTALQSAMSYIGACNLSEYRQKIEYFYRF